MAGLWPDAVEIAERTRADDISPAASVEEAIARCESLNPILNAICHPFYERARTRAVDRQSCRGAAAGVPVLLKDLGLYVRGMPYTAGNKLLKESRYMAPVSSFVTERLEAAGAIILGSTNTPEFGTSPTTESAAFGPARNPWNPKYSASGSSGGAAAAVAAGLVPVAIGNDGAGSIRMPASACGVIGFKPTRGLISDGPLNGVVRAGFTTTGVIARSVRDVALFLDIIAGHTEGDPWWVRPPNVSFVDSLERLTPRDLRIGVMTGPPTDEFSVDAECSNAVRLVARVLEQQGHRVEDNWPDALADSSLASRYFVDFNAVTAAHVISELGRLIGRDIHEHDVEPRNWAFAQRGKSLSPTRYIEALEWFYRFGRRTAKWWTNGFDVLITPVLTQPPWKLGTINEDPVTILAGEWPYPIMAHTWQFNATGQPAISIPASRSRRGLPIGVQLVGRTGQDSILLALTRQLEQLLGSERFNS